MEVAVAEEKKKIFRARKTMKISDRQQLESLHSTLLSSGATLNNPSPPPVLNGRHKEDGHKMLDKERLETSDSQAVSPASPISHGSSTPSLSLNLSPSPPCHSPRNKEENGPLPMSPLRTLNFEPGKSDDRVTPGSPSNGSVDTAPPEAKAGGDTKAAKMDATPENKKEEHTTAEPPATDSLKESGKHSVLNSSPPTPLPVKKAEKDRSESDSMQDMEVGGDASKAKTSTPKTKMDKPCSPKPSSPCTSVVLVKHPAKHVVLEPKGERKLQGKGNKKDIKDEDIKDCKEEVKRGANKVEKMEVDFVKVEGKKDKKDVGVKTTKSFRPSSTPPSETDGPEKSTTSGLKRAMSEGEENGKIERDGKRPKVDGVELEAQLELKITAKAGSRLKLEKVVQQLVEDRLRVLQLTVFDQSLQELKDRVEKIDCATKHQSTLNTLQAKICRLTKKFGEANQALENKKKQEALAAAAAAATAASAAAAVATTTAAVAAKAAGPSGSPSIPRLLRRHSEESQPETPREGLAPSGGKTSALTPKKKKKKMMKMMRDKKGMMQQERKVMMAQEQKVFMPKQKATMQEKKEGGDRVGDNTPQNAGLADRLANFSEGKCRADIKLRPISSQCEKWVYKLCRGNWTMPRADRYASYIFRNLVHYETYCDWVLKVNYVGVLGKDALPRNLRKTLRTYIEKRFTELTCDHWREIRDSINELLRVERRPEFFQTTEEKIPSKYSESALMSS